MSLYALVIALVLTLPWFLFGVVLLGTASSKVARWLGRRARPYRSKTRRRGSPSESREAPTRVSSGAARAPMARLDQRHAV
jgi:hypothetical protein